MTCPCPASKRARCGNSEISTKFKGVAPQDGKWGAKIYANYQLIWLGTFNSEKEAAMAYDSAALKLHHKGNTRNFPCTNVTAEEKFQDGYTMQTLLDMIRVGCYQKKFAEYLKTCSRGRELSVMQSGRKYKQIFSKKLTPSDLNKQYALSIPKLYAIKYFPHISGSAEDVEHGEVKDTYLTFNDMMTRSWKFRYCYWKSSRSFLFKKGWSSFVKENQLKTRDTIIFYMSDSDTEGGAEEVKFLIDYSRHEESDRLR
ncbi:AP2/ERF and B3 domain-containing transcription factor [Quillaja saponaria]|uniref:AP2/ERF and B3 domain-containing transcription factor n=1 Tax=Quillaja saponaria TaxID=32244 RepID=A0AAD7L7B5_QUISA|nr:AP2/ERF and B3 domain-containing transcription factor [Quillaja saponaria]